MVYYKFVHILMSIKGSISKCKKHPDLLFTLAEAVMCTTSEKSISRSCLFQKCPPCSDWPVTTWQVVALCFVGVSNEVCYMLM